MHDAIVIGGGFYGTTIALHLVRRHGLARVLVVEREDDLLQRASYNNQARIHNGYHYPRSFITAFRSRINFPRFVNDLPMAVCSDFTKLYAISRHHSKVSARQFLRFCRAIGADIQPATAEHWSWFDRRRIDALFEVREFAFDARQLAERAQLELSNAGIEVRLATSASLVHQGAANRLSVTVQGKSTEAASETLDTRLLFNCTYSGLNQLGGDFPGSSTTLKHELTEMPLVRVPEAMRRLGVTVMDGPFFSLMPFPSRALHTLSHVRYTPHRQWMDVAGDNPYSRLAEKHTSRFDRMRRDAMHYMPAIADCELVDSLYEIKTVLTKNESDDGRPILFERHAALPGCYSVLGGKIDNVYDAIEKIDQELSLHPPVQA